MGGRPERERKRGGAEALKKERNKSSRKTSRKRQRRAGTAAEAVNTHSRRGCCPRGHPHSGGSAVPHTVCGCCCECGHSNRPSERPLPPGAPWDQTAFLPDPVLQGSPVCDSSGHQGTGLWLSVCLHWRPARGAELGGAVYTSFLLPLQPPLPFNSPPQFPPQAPQPPEKKYLDLCVV